MNKLPNNTGSYIQQCLNVLKQQYAAYQVYTECRDERQVLWIPAVKAEKVKRSSSRFAMYATNSNPACDNSTEEQRAKLQKIKELTNILKDTDRNLTECEEILANYIRKRLRDQQ